MIKRWIPCCLLGLALMMVVGCGYRPRVLMAPPQAAYKTIGMISGNGDNEAAAMSRALAQAERIEAHAIVVLSRRQVASQHIVTCRAIRYLGDPPED